MILLFFLTGKFPLFQSSDDIEALMEITTIIGRQKMEKTAILHSNCRLYLFFSALTRLLQVERLRQMYHQYLKRA